MCEKNWFINFCHASICTIIFFQNSWELRLIFNWLLHSPLLLLGQLVQNQLLETWVLASAHPFFPGSILEGCYLFPKELKSQQLNKMSPHDSLDSHYSSKCFMWPRSIDLWFAQHVTCIHECGKFSNYVIVSSLIFLFISTIEFNKLSWYCIYRNLQSTW